MPGAATSGGRAGAGRAGGEVAQLFARAVGEHRSGALDEAERSYRRVIELDAGNAEAHHNLGGVLFKQGRFDEAQKELEHAIELRSHYPEAHYNLGNIARVRGESERAMRCYEQALRIEPAFVDAHINLGGMLKEEAETYKSVHKAEEALAHFRRVLAIQPDHVGAHSNLGGVLHEMGRLDEAAMHYKACLRIDPDNEAALLGIGRILADLRHLDAALTVHRRALSLNPYSAVAHQCLGRDCLERNELDAARQHFERAVELKPGNLPAQASLGRLLLTVGRFAEGWPLYGLRAAVDGYDLDCFPYAMWEGEPLDGRHILVYAEQGIGDEIMFASCFPDLIRSAGHLTIQCAHRLAPLFARAFPEASVHGVERDESLDWIDDASAVDVKCIAGNLPRYLRPDEASFAGGSPYLSPDRDATAAWKQRLDALGGGAKIGLSWRGGKSAVDRLQRSIDLSQWAPLLELEGVQFVSVQYGAHAQELDRLVESTGHVISRFDEIDPLEDMDDFAAFLSALDLVVSVDNSTVHLAGALGVPVWVLLPFVADWRWMQDRTDNPWYASARLYRQTEWKRWDDVLARVASDLARFVARGESRA